MTNDDASGSPAVAEPISAVGLALIARLLWVVCCTIAMTGLLIDHFESGWSTLMAVILVTGLAAVGVRRAAAKRRRRGVLKLLLVGGLLATAFSGAEKVLFVAGFRYSSHIEFGWPPQEDIQKDFEADPDLFWMLKEEFVGNKPPLKKAADEVRIAYLGDSVTYQHGWVELVHRALDRDMVVPVSYLNAGVPGYTSHQGVIRLQRDVLPYSPDVVLIYFGWNDHWLARGEPDSQKEKGGPWNAVADSFVADSRVLQLTVRVSDYVHYKTTQSRSDRDGPPICRVSKDEYRANLEHIIDLCEQTGAIPVLLTAPTNQTEDNIQFLLIRRSMIRSPGEAVQLHRQYNDVVRSIARERSVNLIDLDEAISGHTQCFTKDGIHFTEKGHKEAAPILIEPIKALVRSNM